MNGAEFGPDGSNWRWKASVAWLWLTRPRLMTSLRRRGPKHLITVPSHTFGDGQ